MKWYLMESVYWNSWNMEWIMIFIPDVQYSKWLLSYVTVHYGRKASVQFISLPFITSILVSFKDFIKGSPEGSSDPEFRSSILYDVIEISGWLIWYESYLDRLKIDWRWRHSIFESGYVGSASLRDSFRKRNWLPSELLLNYHAQREVWIDPRYKNNPNSLFITFPFEIQLKWQFFAWVSTYFFWLNFKRNP